MKRLALFLLLACSAEAQQAAWSGFIDAAYLWNPNTPATRENFVPGTGTSGKRANELSLNLVQLQWSRAASPENPLGFTVALTAGEGNEVVHAGEPAGGDALGHLYQASAAWRMRNGLTIEAGLYPSHIGMEGFYSKDNWNYTRSWLAEFSPYYQAGIKASYAFNSHWSGQLHVLNGWQIARDNNNGKSVGTQLAYANGPLSVSLNTFAGPELAGDDHSCARSWT